MIDLLLPLVLVLFGCMITLLVILAQVADLKDRVETLEVVVGFGLLGDDPGPLDDEPDQKHRPATAGKVLEMPRRMA